MKERGGREVGEERRRNLIILVVYYFFNGLGNFNKWKDIFNIIICKIFFFYSIYIINLKV